MSVLLRPLASDELADFHRTMLSLELWPREKFPRMPTIEEVAAATEEGFWDLLAVDVDGQVTMYISVVKVGLPYFDIHPKTMGVRVDEGRLAVIEVLRWAFTEGGLRDLYFFLPASYVHLADQFLDLGFEPVRDDGATAEGQRLLAIDKPTFRQLAHVYEEYARGG